MHKYNFDMPFPLQTKVKNKTKDNLGTKLGRVHMEKQDLSKLKVAPLKGLKKRKKDAPAKKVPSDLLESAARAAIETQ